MSQFAKRSLPGRTTIRGVDVWNPDGVLPACDVTLRDGRVVEIAPAAAPPDRSLALLPAGVDAQVHLRVPGQPEKETPGTGLRAAVAGGVGALLTMPNTSPVIDSVEALEEARALMADAEGEYGVAVLWSAAVTVGQRSGALAPLEDLAAAGVRAFTDDGRGVETEALMREAFGRLAPLGLPLLQHAEVAGHGGVLAPGPVQEAEGLAPYGPGPEVEMVDRDLRLLREVPGARYHVLHVSSRRTLALLRAAKEEGLAATGEVTPHHLLYTSCDVRPGAFAMKMNPPLRDAEDRRALREALAAGLLDWVATDHAPHDAASKERGFGRAAFGTTGLEAFLRTLLLLLEEGTLTRERLVEVFSTAPARFLGLGPEWGRILPGQPLRAILVDPGDRRPVVREDLLSLSANSCFLGTALPGRVLAHFTAAGIFLLDDPRGRRDAVLGPPEEA